MIYIIRGCPGSGKSTLAKKLVSEEMIFEADKFFVKDGEYVFDRSKLRSAHYHCFEEFCKALDTGKDLVVSNTFIHKWEFMPYIKAAEDNGLSYQVIICTGRFENVHGVPFDVVERMRKNFEF